MKFSLLMSLYDGELPEHFAICMDSLCSQTVQPEEIVLIIDGPIKAELESVISKYRDLLPFIHVYRLSKNLGLQNALNYGIKFCKYEWIFRMDTDDICSPLRFEQQCNYIKEHPNIQLVGGQITEFDKKLSTCIGERRVPTSQKMIRKFAEARSPFNHMTVAYKKSLVLSVSGYPNIKYLEDYGLWLKILAKRNIEVANMDQVLVYVRAGDDLLNRRRGLVYVLSEYRIAKLKHSLGYLGFLKTLLLFLCRASIRFMPVSFLRLFYSKLHT